VLYDPVNTLTGEFYIDDVDLSLPGPMPLQLRRNYGSQNLAANQLGYGWKLSYMPSLVVGISNNLIYCAKWTAPFWPSHPSATICGLPPPPRIDPQQ